MYQKWNKPRALLPSWFLKLLPRPKLSDTKSGGKKPGYSEHEARVWKALSPKKWGCRSVHPALSCSVEERKKWFKSRQRAPPLGFLVKKSWPTVNRPVKVMPVTLYLNTLPGAAGLGAALIQPCFPIDFRRASDFTIFMIKFATGNVSRKSAKGNVKEHGRKRSPSLPTDVML